MTLFQYVIRLYEAIFYAKVQKVLEIEEEITEKIKKVPKYLELIEILRIFAPSKRFLTTPLSAGSKALSILLHLKVTYGWLLFFIFPSEQSVKHRRLNMISHNRYNFLTLKYQNLNSLRIILKIFFYI